MENCRYFIAKVASIQALQRCAETSLWACRDRLTPPQPRSILSSALENSKVVLIFSVNNCHGWHGYAEVLSPPKLDEKQGCAKEVNLNNEEGLWKETKAFECRENNVTEITKINEVAKTENLVSREKHDMTGDYLSEKVVATETNVENRLQGGTDTNSDVKCIDNELDNNTIFNQKLEDTETETGGKAINDLESNNVWHYFQIKWTICIIKEFGEQCLSSKLTEHLNISESLTLNKARNWQEISASVGQTVCSLIDQFYLSLCEKRRLQQQKLLDKQPDPFFKEAGESSTACEETWKKIVEKIEAELGQVILACPFGSQRYNLSVPGSDTDMFIVYQARTRDLLGFHPPKQTIKNSERESCDYTIHEAYRYAELLLSGDARCVETLFLQDSTVVKSSSQWQALKTGRHHFLNQETLSKYLRDAQGTRGTKQLKKWCNDNPSAQCLPQKMCKLLYVVVRLLQNARDIVKDGQLCVFRENDSLDRKTLMRIRQGDITVDSAWEIIRRLEAQIGENKDRVPERQDSTETFLEHWLLQLRRTDFKDQS